MSESKSKKTNEKIAMTDKFVDKFLTHEGETVADAKKRLAQEQAARDEAGKNIGKNAGKH